MKNTDLEIFGKYGGLKISEHTDVQLKYKAMWTEFNALFKQIIDALQLEGIQVTDVKKGLWQNSGYFARYFWNRFYLNFQTKGTLLLYLNLSEHGLRAGIGLNDSSQTSLESEQSDAIYASIVKAVKTAFIQSHFDVADYGNNAGVKPIADLDAAVEDWVDIYKRLIQPYEQIYHQFYLQPNSSKRERMQSLNTILYGPPGTGKTFNTVDKAWKILNVGNTNDTTRPGSIQELKSRYPGQVEFVTFHQSFSYEDFVEGIQAKTQDGKISYQIESGVFKRMAKEASENLAASQKTSEQLSFEMGIEAKLADFISNAITEEKSFSKKKGNPFYIVDSSNDERVKIMSKDTKHSDGVIELKLEDLKLVCMSEGEFSSPKDIAQQIFQKVHARQHDSYFLSILNEFKTFNSAQSYVENRGKVALKPYILIIDEINRGNISRIFGELITLIEPSKRAGNDEAIEVTLPYSKESFSVPNNLYIIGTMNTADRSLALMDTALRRRFDFIEMMPQPDLVTEDLEGIDLRKILQVMNQRIEALYDREHTLGHAFLMNVDSLKGLQQAFKNKILPLLEEYFYDDWQKIRWVLGASADNFYQRQSFGHLFTDADAPNDIEKFQRNNLDDLDAQAFVAIYQGA